MKLSPKIHLGKVSIRLSIYLTMKISKLYLAIIDLNPSQAVGKISHGHRMVLPENCDCPPDLKRLMENCWAPLPEDRPDFKEICKYIENMK